MLTQLDVIDSAVKIGLGALIGIFGSFIAAKQQHSLELRKDTLRRRQDALERIAEISKLSKRFVDLNSSFIAFIKNAGGAGQVLKASGTPYTLTNDMNKKDMPKRITLQGVVKCMPKRSKRPARPIKLAKRDEGKRELSAASAPALQAILQALGAMEARLRRLDQQIETLAAQSVEPQTKALVESMPGFDPTTAAKVRAYLPSEILHSGPNRKIAARLQAFMGNDPRLKESGQWKGQTKMSKRGVETLRTAFFQAAFSAAQHDPELKAFYQRKRAEGKTHHVAPHPQISRRFTLRNTLST